MPTGRVTTTTAVVSTSSHSCWPSLTSPPTAARRLSVPRPINKSVRVSLSLPCRRRHSSPCPTFPRCPPSPTSSRPTDAFSCATRLPRSLLQKKLRPPTSALRPRKKLRTPNSKLRPHPSSLPSASVDVRRRTLSPSNPSRKLSSLPPPKSSRSQKCRKNRKLRQNRQIQRNRKLRPPTSELRTPNSELRTPNSELRTPQAQALCL